MGESGFYQESSRQEPAFGRGVDGRSVQICSEKVVSALRMTFKALVACSVVASVVFIVHRPLRSVVAVANVAVT